MNSISARQASALVRHLPRENHDAQIAMWARERPAVPAEADPRETHAALWAQREHYLFEGQQPAPGMGDNTVYLAEDFVFEALQHPRCHEYGWLVVPVGYREPVRGYVAQAAEISRLLARAGLVVAGASLVAPCLFAGIPSPPLVRTCYAGIFAGLGIAALGVYVEFKMKKCLAADQWLRNGHRAVAGRPNRRAMQTGAASPPELLAPSRPRGRAFTQRPVSGSRPRLHGGRAASAAG